MDDPWHRETLNELIAVLRNVRRGVRAVVVTSRPELAEDVEAELRGVLEKHDIIEVIWTEEPERTWTGILDAEPCSGRYIFVKGEPDLGYLNLHRELFDRKGEAFVLFVNSSTATRLIAEAPNFHRYTQCFDFPTWDDLMAMATSQEDQAWAELDNWQQRENDAGLRVEKLRKSGADTELLTKALIGHVLTLHECAQPWRALALAREAESLARDTGDINLHAKALARLSFIYLGIGDSKEALKLSRQAARIGIDLSDPWLRSDIHTALSYALYLSGRLTDAAHECEIAEAALSKAGDTSDITINRSYIFMALGQPQKAACFIGKIPNKHIDLNTEAAQQCVIVKVEILLGHLPKAARHLGRALVLSRAVPRIDLLSLKASILFLSAIGQPIRAHALLLRLLETVKTNQNALEDCTLRILFAGVLITLGDVREARDQGTLAEEAIRQHGWRLFAASAARTLGNALEASGDPPAARDALKASIDISRETGQVLERADSQRSFGRLERLEGHLDEAAHLLDDALAIDREAGARPAEVRDLTELAFLDLARGDAPAAEHHAQEALDLLRQTRTVFDEPAALAALACAREASGRDRLAKPLHERWQRLVDGMQAPGLRRQIERSIAALH